MQINQISQILQPQVGQTKSNVDNSSSNSNQAFDLLLQEMMQDSGNQDTSNSLGLDSNNSINSTDLINGLNGTDLTSSSNTSAKPTSGLDSLSLNPQKMAQMLQIMQESSANNVMASLSSDDGSGDDSSSSDGLDALGNSNPMGGTDDMTQLLQTVLQNQDTSGSKTTNTNDLNAELQQLTANMQL